MKKQVFLFLAVSFFTISTPFIVNAQSPSDFEVKDSILVKYNGRVLDVTIPRELGITTIGNNVFPRDITSVTIPEGVKNIDNNAFHGRDKLVTIFLPSSLERIGDYAFKECGFANIKFPDSLTEIGKEAFTDCKRLSEINIPKNVQAIGEKAFHGCYRLAKTTVDKNSNCYFSDSEGVLFDKRLSSLIIYPRGKSNAKYIVPSATKTISDYAFSGNTTLTEVVLPNGLQKIGIFAFSRSNIEKINLPDTLEIIGDYAFESCDKITVPISIPSSLKTLGEASFQGCLRITTVSIPGTLSVISRESFDRCIRLSSLKLSEGITIIKREAFNGCRGLLKIDIPSSVITLEDYSFSNCTNAESIILSRNTQYERSSFQGIPRDITFRD